MIRVERDSARRGFEITIELLNKQMFISDNKINSNPYLYYVVRLLNFPNQLYWKLWRMTHKKQIEFQEQKNKQWLDENMKRIERNMWIPKGTRETTVEIYTIRDEDG